MALLSIVKHRKNEGAGVVDMRGKQPKSYQGRGGKDGWMGCGERFLRGDSWGFKVAIHLNNSTELSTFLERWLMK